MRHLRLSFSTEDRSKDRIAAPEESRTRCTFRPDRDRTSALEASVPQTNSCMSRLKRAKNLRPNSASCATSKFTIDLYSVAASKDPAVRGALQSRVCGFCKLIVGVCVEQIFDCANSRFFEVGHCRRAGVEFRAWNSVATELPAARRYLIL